MIQGLGLGLYGSLGLKVSGVGMRTGLLDLALGVQLQLSLAPLHRPHQRQPLLPLQVSDSGCTFGFRI